jgi:hypothetical protein
VALMRHRIASVIIAVRRSYSGPGHALMPPIARQLRRMTPSAAVMSDQQASGQQDHRGPGVLVPQVLPPLAPLVGYLVVAAFPPDHALRVRAA